MHITCDMINLSCRHGTVASYLDYNGRYTIKRINNTMLQILERRGIYLDTGGLRNSSHIDCICDKQQRLKV